MCKQERLVNITVYTEVTNILPEALFTLHTSQPLPSLLPPPSDSRNSHYLSTLIFSCHANLKCSVYCHQPLVSIVAIRQFVGTKCSQCTSINTQSAELRFLNTVNREIFTIKKFSLVASVAKIKRVKTKYTYMHYIAEPQIIFNVKTSRSMVCRVCTDRLCQKPYTVSMYDISMVHIRWYHLTVLCACGSSPHHLVPPVQLMRSGNG